MTVSVERPCAFCGKTLNGHSGIRHFGSYSAHQEATCRMYLKSEVEALRAVSDAAEEREKAARAEAWEEGRNAAAECRLSFPEPCGEGYTFIPHTLTEKGLRKRILSLSNPHAKEPGK